MCLLSAGKVSTARSAEFLLPHKLSELVLGGMELGAADDLVGHVSSTQVVVCASTGYRPVTLGCAVLSL